MGGTAHCPSMGPGDWIHVIRLGSNICLLSHHKGLPAVLLFSVLQMAAERKVSNLESQFMLRSTSALVFTFTCPTVSDPWNAGIRHLNVAPSAACSSATGVD